MPAIRALLVTLVLVSPGCATSSRSWAPTAEERKLSPAEQGRRVHERVLDSYPGLDPIYRDPDLVGGLTDDPVVVISAPRDAWDSLSPATRELLFAYVESLVPDARTNPLKCARVSSSAPAAPQVKRNASKMTSKSAGVQVGRVSENGRDIYSDQVIRR